MNSVLDRTGTSAVRERGAAGAGVAVAPSGVLVGVSPLEADGGPQVALPEGTPSLHVLVVDDDAAVRKACCVIAAGKGFAVGEAGSVAQDEADDLAAARSEGNSDAYLAGALGDELSQETVEA